MENYDLAKLVQWAGKLRTRKRMQKVVFLMKAAGCPFDAEYRLHYFGPYSADVAGTADVLTHMGMFQEERAGNPAGSQFNYSLTPKAINSVSAFEQTEEGQRASEQLEPFRQLADKMMATDGRLLEIAATIAYFWERNKDWTQALDQACSFKSLQPKDAFTQRALSFAQEVLDPR